MKTAKFLVLAFLLTINIISLGTCLAEEAVKAPPKCLEGIEFYTGFGWGKLVRGKRNLNIIPFIVDFDFNLKPLIQKLKLKPKQLVQFQLEPFLSGISSPEGGIETGVSFLFKVGILPQTSKFQPYGKIGIGMNYMTLHTNEQGTQFNFTEQGGIGMHYFFRKNLGLTLEGRIRHLSNAGIDQPNHGINSYFVLTGLTYEF